MKKGVVILLVVVVLIVLVTPGIIGRLAEESIDQNLEMAVTETEDVVVSSLGFVRGWFTSEGQHRIELRDRGLPADPDDADDERRYVDALIVTTRIDHGLIPVTSMAREEGSLAPGLGSAVSTVSVEVSDGSLIDIPGKVYSQVGLTGELQSNFLLEADKVDAEGRLLEWGAADLLVTSNAATGAMSVKGEINASSMSSPQETLRVGLIEIDGEQAPGPFGYPLGSVDLRIDSLSIRSTFDEFTVGPMTLESNVEAVGDRVDADVRFQITDVRSDIGDAGITWHARIVGADGDALGELIRSHRDMSDPDLAWAALKQSDVALEGLLATGMELHFDRFDLVLPQGTVSSTLHLAVLASSPDEMSWAEVILALDGTLEVSVSQGIVDFITGQFPEFGAAVPLGYLRKSGDLYESLVEIRSGILTINGAPMQIPLDAFQ